MAADKSELRAELAGAPSEHAAADAKGPGFIRRGQHNPATHGDGLSAQGRVEQLLDRRIKGIEVSMEDGGFHPNRSSLTRLPHVNIKRTEASIVKPRAMRSFTGAAKVDPSSAQMRQPLPSRRYPTMAPGSNPLLFGRDQFSSVVEGIPAVRGH